MADINTGAIITRSDAIFRPNSTSLCCGGKGIGELVGDSSIVFHETSIGLLLGMQFSYYLPSATRCLPLIE